jgi:hypothetical protein
VPQVSVPYSQYVVISANATWCVRLFNADVHNTVVIVVFRPASANRPAACKSNRQACLRLQQALGSKVKAMTFATGEPSTTCVPTAMRSAALVEGGNCLGVPSLMVRECFPAMASVAHKAPLRTAYISKTNEALALSWIEKLPGQKRIRFVHGQIFVIQHYLGMRVIRAHICRADEKCASPSRQNQEPPELIVPRISFENKMT